MAHRRPLSLQFHLGGVRGGVGGLRTGQRPFEPRQPEETLPRILPAARLAVFEVFIDPGESARTVDRPEFQQMLAYCRAHRREVRYVVVQDLSRFARNNRDQAQTIAELGRIGVLLRSTYESTLTRRWLARWLRTWSGPLTNQCFSDALSEKMQDRTRQAAKARRFPWRAPLGYRNVGGNKGPNIVPDQHDASLMRRAFDLIATGRTRRLTCSRSSPTKA